MEKVALYCKVSNNTQTNENQKLRLLQYAAEKNLCFDLYEEIESMKKNRAVKQELMQKLRQHKYKAVVVYKFFGWASSFTELIIDCKKILENGINFISICDNLELISTSSLGDFQIINAFPDFNREIFLEQNTHMVVQKKGCQKTAPKMQKYQAFQFLINSSRKSLV